MSEEDNLQNLRPKRRRQRDILSVNRFDQLPIDERISLPYEVSFRFLSNLPDNEHLAAQIQQILKYIKLDQISTDPLINQSVASFEIPLYSQRCQGVVHGILSEIPALVILLINRFLEFTGVGLDNQIKLEIINLESLFYTDKFRVGEECVECSSFGIGNIPNAGTYLERVSYESFENSFSNVRMINNSLTTINNIAGSHVLSSWLDVNFYKKLINISFAVPIHKVDSTGLKFKGYRLALQFSAVREITICPDFSETEHLLLIRYKSPPQLWEAFPKMVYGKLTLNLADCREWSRELGISDECTLKLTKNHMKNACVLAVGLPKRPPLPADAAPYEKRNSEANEGLKIDMTHRILSTLGRIQAISKTKVFFSSIHRIRTFHEPEVILPIYDSFRASYAVQGLIERGYAIIDQLYSTFGGKQGQLPIFFQKVADALQENQEACEETLEDLLAICDERRLSSLLYSFDQLYHQKIFGSQDPSYSNRIADIPKNCVLVRKVIITPLRRIFLPPEVMMSNRVVRHFGEEWALRCTFRDDNGQRLAVRNFLRCSSKSPFTNLIVETMIKDALLDSIDIGGRNFRFLAWSNSQMRDHCCYLYADIVREGPEGVEFLNVDNIRDWMGDFSKIKSVPKLMSRMGQCFTQAQPTVQLRRKDWDLITDYESQFMDPYSNKHYTFSDGVGRISEKYARRVAAILGISPVPSCFQVRFKGFKGIVVAWPNLADAHMETELMFRESQKKFDDDKEDDKATLEVVKYSMPSLVCLNRPLIMILDQVLHNQDLRKHAILKKRVTEIVEGELDTLGTMLYDDKVAASQLEIRTNSPIDFNRLAKAGFLLTDEPFFRQMLLSIYKYCIIQDMSKLKVPVPQNCGRTMFGVIDELGYLNPGQVFFQYSPSVSFSSSMCTPFVGPVMVTKNPCHVPGDVRLFEAVDLPEYHHLRDVIVFPRHGIRPHPDEMAGSDLDGDEYAVFFDEDLFYVKNEHPMHFPKATALEMTEKPTTADMVDFFLKYLELDTIGRVSNAHLNAADQLGIYDEVCANLAAKCSIAVDFPKTGEPAEPLSQEERFDTLPDFMGCNNRNTYASHWLLGKLYRKIHILEEVLDHVSIQDSRLTSQADPLLLDEDLAVTHPHFFKDAIHSRDVYYAKIQQILDEYGIESEAEMMSGHALSIRRITEMEKQDYSFYHVDRLVEMRMNQITENFRRDFFDDYGGESKCLEPDSYGNVEFVGPTEALFKARCWYTVAYGKSATEKNIKYRSFPWLIWDVMLPAKRKKKLQLLQQTGNIPKKASVLLPALNQYILDYCNKHSDELGAFDSLMNDEYDKLQCYEIYVALYGSKLALTLFFIHNWLSVNGVYKSISFSAKHLVMMALGFAMGSSIGPFVNIHPLLREKADSLPEALLLRQSEDAPEKFSDCGFLLLEFVRFLGSSNISLATKLDFTQIGLTNRDEQGGLEPCILINQMNWLSISKLAYRTFHYVTLTRNFDAFTFPLHELTKS